MGLLLVPLLPPAGSSLFVSVSRNSTQAGRALLGRTMALDSRAAAALRALLLLTMADDGSAIQIDDVLQLNTRPAPFSRPWTADPSSDVDYPFTIR